MYKLIKLKEVIFIFLLIFTVSCFLKYTFHVSNAQPTIIPARATPLQTQNNISLIITQANYFNDSHKIQIKFLINFQQYTEITTPDTTLLYYWIRASSSENWLFPTVSLPAVTTHSFDKGTYSYARNFTLDNADIIFNPSYFDIAVILDTTNVSGECRIIKENSYSYNYKFSTPLFSPGFTSWLLFTSLASLMIIRIKRQQKKII